VGADMIEGKMEDLSKHRVADLKATLDYLPISEVNK